MHRSRSTKPRSRGRPPTGRAQTAAERMRRYRARKRANAHLDAPERALTRGALQHRVLEARSLAMHCLAALKIERDPRLLDRVRRTLERWRVRHGDAMPRAFDEWDAILREPWPVIAASIIDPGERGTRLRQSTPFASVLSARERNRIYAAFRS